MIIARYVVFIILSSVMMAGFSRQSDIKSIGVFSDGNFYTVDSSFNIGDKLKMVDSNGNIHCCATILRRGGIGGDANVYDALNDRTIYSYVMSISNGIGKDSEGMGVLNEIDAKKGRGGVDVTINGVELTLLSCTSTEGVHYFARRKSDGKIVVDIYKFLNIDLEPNCKGDSMR